MLNLNTTINTVNTQTINAEISRIVWAQTGATTQLPVAADVFYRYYTLENISIAEANTVCDILLASLISNGFSEIEAEDKMLELRDVTPLWKLREQAKKNLTK